MSTKRKRFVKAPDIGIIGLDIGTDAVGYAVMDDHYKLMKYQGEPMWGVTMFEPANSKEERRDFRTERRRLDRSQQRVLLTQEIFAKEIAKVDSQFFIRIKEGGLYREDTSTKSTYHLFEEKNYTDRDYHEQYPTIHHLIVDLIENEKPHDIRLLYLAVEWLMKHRGHFLNASNQINVDQIVDFSELYEKFSDYCEDYYGEKLWECDPRKFAETMMSKIAISAKEKNFYQLLNHGKRFGKESGAKIDRNAVIKLLSGGKIKPARLFPYRDLKELESVSLEMDEEVFQGIVEELDEDGELLLILRDMYNWVLLEKTLAGQPYISVSKVQMYEQHKKDLAYLKSFVRKYIPKKYFLIFREEGLGNYVAYSGHGRTPRCSQEDFCSFLGKMLKDIKVEDGDSLSYEEMMERISDGRFMPRQTGRGSRVIPYQLYLRELSAILINAKQYFPFLSEEEDGISNMQKLLAVFTFQVPYYVGPLRKDNSSFSWIKRKSEGKIYPWNFDKRVDLKMTEQAFIDQMRGQCRYLPGEDVLPKSSLLYARFLILEDLNSKVTKQGIKYSVLEKQTLFYESWQTKNASARALEEMLSEEDAEEIIRYFTYVQDKKRRHEWLLQKYPNLSETDQKRILKFSFHDFGKVSARFLTQIQGVNKETGEIMTIMEALWNTTDSLQEILSDAYTFSEIIEAERRKYYEVHEMTVRQILDQHYVPNSMRRPIYRTLAVLHDIRTVMKRDPKKICLTMMETMWEKREKRYRYRQLSETRQAPKALSTVLRLLYPKTEIVYVRPGVLQDFRKKYDLVRVRSINDFYHGKDAYLNAVFGNNHGLPITESKEQVVRKVMDKNHMHYTRFLYERKGGLFDQMPVKKGNGYVRRKADLPVQKYGGYNRPTASFFIFVRFRVSQHTDLIFLPVDRHETERVINDRRYAVEYAKRSIKIALKKGEPEILDFPFGLRKFRMNTMLSFDGYRMTINGSASAKRQLIVASQEALVLTQEQERYVKRLENFIKRRQESGISRVDRWEDKINGADNLKLYNALTIKMGNPKFQEQFGPNLEYLEKSRDTFQKLRLDEQTDVLMNMIRLFKQGRVVGCDLSKVGGKKNSGNRPLAANLSNWRKRFTDVRILDISPSGIFEKQSVNLLKLF